MRTLPPFTLIRQSLLSPGCGSYFYATFKFITKKNCCKLIFTVFTFVNDFTNKILCNLFCFSQKEWSTESRNLSYWIQMVKLRTYCFQVFTIQQYLLEFKKKLCNLSSICSKCTIFFLFITNTIDSFFIS